MTTPARAAEECPGSHAGAARGDVGTRRDEDARREERASADERARAGADERARAGADAPRSAAPPAPRALRSASAARRARRRALLHAALGAFGLVALIALIRHVGAAALLATVSRAAPLLPLLVALEAARLGCELLATRALCPPGSVPLAELARIHVVAYPVASLMPAGRATAEAVKAAMLSPHVGAPRAAAIGTANQSLALLSAAPLSLLAALAVGWTNGASPLAAGLLVHVALSVASGLCVAFAARQRAAFAWITRRFARAGHATAAFQEAVRAHPPVPGRPFAAFCAGRALQAVQYAVLLAAVGADSGPLRALAAYGVGAIGTAAGDLIPAQIGATDGAFTLAAPLLGLTVSSAIAVSVLAHLLQAVGALTGIAITLAWRRAAPAT
ncbi:lysylphosphatidylglycerol synthase domain-containing protein [Sorangium sp. So ce1036]|uniref:lysylphosphatidylglycerol synthase domain-containing protein n=1 Tax=Sorangium sp. So ce1036 TaxID=3133328 RepID=UPI003EFEED92